MMFVYWLASVHGVSAAKKKALRERLPEFLSLSRHPAHTALFLLYYISPWAGYACSLLHRLSIPCHRRPSIGFWPEGLSIRLAALFTL